MFQDVNHYMNVVNEFLDKEDQLTNENGERRPTMGRKRTRSFVYRKSSEF